MHRALALLLVPLALGCPPQSFCPDGGRCLAFDDYCQALTTRDGCQRARACGLLPADTACATGTAACSPTLRAAVASGRLRFESPKAAACLDGADCQACDALFRWTDDGGCVTHEGCGSASFCSVQLSCPGRCSPKAAAGAEVSSPRGCASGASVPLSSERFRCVSTIPLLQPCERGSAMAPCVRGAACVAEDAGARCVAEAAAGAACGPATPCAYEHACVGGRCVPVAGAGEPCGDAVARCAPSLACVSDRCAALAAGASCTATPAACEAAAFCATDGGVCAARSASGASCGDELPCVPGARCLEGRCALERLTGEACDGQRPCGPGLACDGVQCTAALCAAP